MSPRSNPSTSTIYEWAEQLRRKMMEEYRLVQEAEYAAAEHATNGVMLNKKHANRYHDTWDVFFAAGPVRTAYASEELLEHLAAHPMTTRTAFEKQWVENHLEGAL